MKRRALWFGGAALALTACGPMPGYVAPQDRSEPRERNTGGAYDEPGTEAGVDRARPARVEEEERAVRVGSEGREVSGRRVPTPPAEPAPVEPEVSVEVERVPIGAPEVDPAVTPSPPPAVAPVAAPSPAPSRLQVVPLDRSDSYYLIDRDRGLCFFIHKETSAKIDCAIIPEGRDVVSPPTAVPAPPAVAPAPPPPVVPPPAADPAQGVRRRYVEPAPAPAETSPVRRDAASAPRPASEDGAPTADELNRFEEAYIEISCDRRQGSFTSPHARIQAAGLSPERYTAVEGWLTSDERSWRLLVSRAYRECDARK